MRQVILITGASSGIGKATALQLLRERHIVYGAARRLEQMAELEEAGGHALEMDITDTAQITAAVEQIIREQGRIDVLINNAGFAVYGAVEDVPLQDARKQFDVNLFGMAEVTRAVLPQMREQQDGRIINVSSMGGKIYTPLGAWYHASKHAVEGWSDCLRLELKAFNIKVIVIEPGLIATNFGDVMTGPMMRYSGEGPYAKWATAVAQTTEATYEKKGASSPPGVVAKTIQKAIAAPKPKTRYVTGKMARQLLLVRKFLGDRIFDKIITSQID
ncbi:MAG: oxidoreductase [Saprospiraceae bacterium]|nr:oxidoreductase [Saprospiraceae bacterium]